MNLQNQQNQQQKYLNVISQPQMPFQNPQQLDQNNQQQQEFLEQFLAQSVNGPMLQSKNNENYNLFNNSNNNINFK